MSTDPDSQDITYEWNVLAPESSPIHHTFNGDDGARLLLEAKQARSMAHAPYSSFSVGAAVRMDDVDGNFGEIWRGCNVENASYGATSCAERNALFSAIAHGGKRIRILALTLDSSILENADQLALRSPCGICRQVIQEFSDENTAVLIDSGPRDGFDLTGDILGIADLLPWGFRL